MKANDMDDDKEIKYQMELVYLYLKGLQTDPNKMLDIFLNLFMTLCVIHEVSEKDFKEELDKILIKFVKNAKNFKVFKKNSVCETE